MIYSLDGCRAKVNRAKEHTDGLNEHIRKTFLVEANCPGVGIKFDAQTRKHVLYISSAPDLTEFSIRASLIFGDAIHNFRCTLDHLLWQLACKTTGDPSGGNIKNARAVQSPIVDSSQQWADTVKYRLAEVHTRYHAIIERFQPYNRIAEGLTIGLGSGGGYFHSFRLLRDLDDADKHRLVTPVLLVPSAIGGAPEPYLIYCLAVQQQPQLFVNRPPLPIELGTVIASATVPADQGPIPDMEVAGHITPAVTLPEGWPIRHVIERITSLTTRLIREIEPIF